MAPTVRAAYEDSRAPRAVVLMAPRNAWGIRRSAKYIDSRLDGLRIYRYRGIKCSDRPRAMCVRTRVRDMGDTWVGYAAHRDGNWTITLNRWFSFGAGNWRQHVATHELMHTLGWIHYESPGSVGSSGVVDFRFPFPTDREISIMRNHYNS